MFLRSFPTGRRPELACKKQRSILYAGSDGARGGRRVIGVTPCWARTRFRSLVPGLVTLTLVRSRTGIVRSRSSRSEEYLSFTPRRAIHPSRRRTAGRHQTAIQFLERSFLTWLFLRRSFLPARARRGHGRISGCFLGALLEGYYDRVAAPAGRLDTCRRRDRLTRHADMPGLFDRPLAELRTYRGRTPRPALAVRYRQRMQAIGRMAAGPG